MAALAGSYTTTLGWLVPSLLDNDELIFHYFGLGLYIYCLAGSDVFASWFCTRFASLLGVLAFSYI